MTSVQSEVLVLADLAGTEFLPYVVALCDDLRGVCLRLRNFVVRELVLRFAIGHFVVAEPIQNAVEHFLVNVVDVMKFGEVFTLFVDTDDLPVSFALVDQAVQAENLDLAYFANGEGLIGNLDNIERIRVTW